MNKTAIKNFAIWARKKLISEITYKAGLIGITEKGIINCLDSSTNNVQFFDIGTGKPTEIYHEEIKQRESLVKYIREKERESDYNTAFHFIMEEVAYTWFNRLIAIRFMEVNEYLPSGVRVLSSESQGKIEPDIVTTPFDSDLEFTSYEIDKIIQLKDKNRLDELFRMLFIKQCNKLNEVLPELFEKTNDYTELLLNISFTDNEGIVSHLLNDIEEESFIDSIEIIGWMYQYYNTEPKDVRIGTRKKYKKDDIPFVTQLFTPDWIVRLIVDNSLGRYWLERNPNSGLESKMEYFILPKNNKLPYINETINPEEITFFDPCMGSGHILVYAFDILMEIYRESGYVDRDAVQSIIKNNLFGLDIDGRAYQLAYFAIMMKARSYDRRFLTRGIEPNISVIIETNDIAKFDYDGIINDKNQNEISRYLISAYQDSKEIGTLINIKNYDYNSFEEYLNSLKFSGQLTIESEFLNREFIPTMIKVIKQARIMSNRYNIVCTNPPYMNSSYMTPVLKKMLEKEYNDYKTDIFSAFIVKCIEYCKEAGQIGLLTPYVWMFIASYEKLRNKILNNTTISTLVQLEYNAFEAACVPVCAFTLENRKLKYNGDYIKLSEFKGVDVQAPKTLEAINNIECDYRYSCSQDKFFNIPGVPISYWVSEDFIRAFEKGSLLGDLIPVKKGMDTGNNEYFLKFWFEVFFSKISLYDGNNKWIPYDKGGNYRKWFGNNQYILRWSNDGSELRNSTANLRSKHLYFKKSITWNALSSSSTCFRYSMFGGAFDSAGSSMFPCDEDLDLYLGVMNTKIAQYYLNVINPTLNYGSGSMSQVPILFDKSNYLNIKELVKQNISISKNDWDSFETSWDFITHPLIKYRIDSEYTDSKQSKNQYKISDAFRSLKFNTEANFLKLKSNEEELNRIFIDIYGLKNELTPEVQDKDVTVSRIYDKKGDIPENMKDNNYVLTCQDIIKSFISYTVGCMFGRYSLDVDGLIQNGQELDENKYKTFKPNKANCILISDEEYFEDDIVGLFVQLVKKIYGEQTLEDNLDFIAKVLGNKGSTSREIIRNYFVKDFYKDHIKNYQKRPIYWLYDSGRQDGFKLMVSMHRYNADTTGLVRVEYLHKMQKIYTSEINRMQEIVENSKNSNEIIQAEKRKEKLVKQLKEVKEYDEKIAHLALARIEIDLDDGVKINYDKVQTAQDGKKLSILGKI